MSEIQGEEKTAIKPLPKILESKKTAVDIGSLIPDTSVEIFIMAILSVASKKQLELVAVSV